MYGLSFLIFFPAYISGPIQRYPAYVRDQLQPWRPMTFLRFRDNILRISLGVIKILLVAGLLRGAAWSYPTALAGLAGFMIYQLYRVSLTHSLALIILTAFDAVILLLIWQEWRRVRRTRCLPSR